jgi:Transcriptional regulator containing an amidase domain and an AraC-type DNA-binding HTH domain
MKTELLKLTTILQENFEQISAQTSLIIFKIIILTVSKIPDGYWNLTTSDQRIIGTLRMIDEHLDKELTNETLAHHARMAVNSFARLFKSELGMPPQQFIKQRKIQKASILLHHSNNKIDEIAKISGFCDRFHFTKAFKESTGLTPPQYRKRFYSGKR